MYTDAFDKSSREIEDCIMFFFAKIPQEKTFET